MFLEDQKAVKNKKEAKGVNTQDVNVMTSLHTAAARGMLDVIESLCKMKAQIDLRDDAGETALHHAASFGHVKAAELLIEKKASMEIENQEGRTPLFVAVEENRVSVVRYLLENKAEVDATDSKDWTPLMSAVQNCQVVCVELLLKAKANLAVMKQGRRWGSINFIDAAYASPDGIEGIFECDKWIIFKLLKENGVSDWGLSGYNWSPSEIPRVAYRVFYLKKERHDKVRIQEELNSHGLNKDLVNIVFEYLYSENIKMLSAAPPAPATITFDGFSKAVASFLSFGSIFFIEDNFLSVVILMLALLGAGAWYIYSELMPLRSLVIDHFAMQFPALIKVMKAEIAAINTFAKENPMQTIVRFVHAVNAIYIAAYFFFSTPLLKNSIFPFMLCAEILAATYDAFDILLRVKPLVIDYVAMQAAALIRAVKAKIEVMKAEIAAISTFAEENPSQVIVWLMRFSCLIAAYFSDYIPSSVLTVMLYISTFVLGYDVIHNLSRANIVPRLTRMLGLFTGQAQVEAVENNDPALANNIQNGM